MTPHLWLNLIILIAGDLAFCGALYLTKEATEGNILKPTDNRPASYTKRANASTNVSNVSKHS